MNAAARARIAPVLGPALVLAFATLLMLWWRNRGFDLTDEAYYLAWTTDPARYDVSIHPAGLFFHVAVWRPTHSVIALRLAGFALLLGTGAAFGAQLARYYAGIGTAMAPRGLALLAAVLTTAFYGHGIATPGYNLLALAGALLAGAGLLAWATPGRGHMGAALAMGVGAALAFLGKPPLAAMLALAVAGGLLWQARRSPAGAARMAVLVGIACVLPLVVVLAASVWVAGFVDSVVAGRAVLDFNNSLPRLLARAPRDIAEAPLYIAAPIVALLLAVAGARDGGVGRNQRRAVAAVLALALVAWPYSVARWIAMGAAPWAALGPGALAVATAFVAWGVARSGEARAARLLPILALLAAPLLIGFGTANDWWLQVGMSLPFLLLAGVLAARVFFPRAVVLADAVACAATVALLGWAAYAPYRLPIGLAGQDRPIRLPVSGETWYVDPATARMAQTLAAVAPQARGAPLVDLANQGPGIAALLGMRAPFFPWLNANFGNAGRLADAAWGSMTPAEQARAWFVLPVAPALADTAPVRHLRANPTRYVVAARVRQPLTGVPLAIVRPR